ncbi:hypothetical protein Tco_0413070 [Tanacetum coccineum]
MTTLKFADTHNMVAFLAKPAESEGFEQIVDFLNAHTIKYALTINPTIYTSCIEQFWATVKAKTVNGEVQLQALVDGKKIIITESIVRRDLQLEDAEGVDCLPNATIFEQLTLMGYEKISQKLTFYKAFFSPQWKFLIHTILQCLSSKTTAWNEFSSTMASAIIYLATNQNFSKYIFKSMVKNLDNVGKFLIYPRFVQVFVNQQLDGLPSHKRIYVTPSHTKKIFGNMKRVGKGFSGRVTSLFPTMVVHNQEEMGIDLKTMRPKRKDTEVPQPSSPTTNVADEAVNEELHDSLVRAATTASSLEAELDGGNINKTQSKATPNEPSSPGTSLGGGPKRQETMGIQLLRLCLRIVLDLETTKNTQANEIAREVADIDANKDIYLVNVYIDEDMFGVNDLDGEEVIVDNVDVVKTAEETRSVVEEVTDVIEKAKLVSAAEETVNAAATTVTLAELKSAASTIPKVKGIVIHEQEQAPTPTVSLQQPSQVKVQDKDKCKMVEPEPMKKMSKKNLLRLDEELAFKLQAEEEEEKRLAREKAQQIEEANIAWDDFQAKIDADYQLAQRLQAQEQEELTDEEKAGLFVQFLEQRRKHFAAKRAEEKSNRPPTRAQQRSIMCTYLKNMKGWKPKSLKNKSFANIQELFDKAMKRVNTFVDYRTNSKKQKVEEDKETAKLQSLIEIVFDEEEVAINAIPLATMPPTIVDWKIHKEGKNNYYQIIRVDGSSKMYRVFSQMLKSFDKQYLEDLYKLEKDK